MVNAPEDKTCQFCQAKGARVDVKYFCNQTYRFFDPTEAF